MRKGGAQVTFVTTVVIQGHVRLHSYHLLLRDRVALWSQTSGLG